MFVSGEHFDIRDFHSVVLENGPVPLRILESLVDKWIDTHHLSGRPDYKKPTTTSPDTGDPCICPPHEVVKCKASGAAGVANFAALCGVPLLNVCLWLGLCFWGVRFAGGGNHGPVLLGVLGS